MVPNGSGMAATTIPAISIRVTAAAVQDCFFGGATRIIAAHADTQGPWPPRPSRLARTRAAARRWFPAHG